METTHVTACLEPAKATELSDHLVAIEQLRDTAWGGGAYVVRKRGEGKTQKEAMGCLQASRGRPDLSRSVI